jgi:hypothetical protein
VDPLFADHGGETAVPLLPDWQIDDFFGCFPIRDGMQLFRLRDSCRTSFSWQRLSARSFPEDLPGR